MKKIYEADVDKWIEENKATAAELFDKMLPKHRRKFDLLDKKIIKLLKEVREVFPDASYYTAAGGFNLLLGNSHTPDVNGRSREKRTAWSGFARIGDGDW